MSTKTTFKRVALVAVAGLVTGLVSVAPASAATTPAFTGGVYSSGTAGTATGDVTVVVATAGVITRTGVNTWAAPFSLAVTGTDITADSDFTVRKVLDPHGIHIHSLRHTYAYILKSQGIHVTTAQKLMGHSDPKITMAIYTRVLDNEIDSAGAILRRMTN
jgi:hypothetical protein